MTSNRAAHRAAASQNCSQIIIPMSDILQDDDALDGDLVIQRVIDRIERLSGPLSAAAVAQLTESMANEMALAEANERCAALGMLPVSSCLYHSPVDEQAGQQMLRDLLPLARELAASPDAPVLPQSALTEGLRANRFRIADLVALMIYQAPAGAVSGWHGDIVFGREMHPLSAVVGSAIAAPFSTRAQAEAWVLRMLAGLVREAHQQADA